MKGLQTCRVNVMVSDMDISIDFYVNKLGLQLINRYGDHYCEIQAPDLLIGLHPASRHISTGDNMSIGFGVTEFDASMSALKTQGIDLSLEQDGWMRLAYFSDPDGNQLFLAERNE